MKTEETQTPQNLELEEKQYHHPKDLQIIEQQRSALATATAEIEQLKTDLEDKTEIILSQEDLIEKANLRIDETGKELKELRAEKANLRHQIESEKASEMIQRAMAFADAEKEKAVAAAQAEAEKVIQAAQAEAERIKAEAEKDAALAEERKDQANKIYLDLTSHLEDYQTLIQKALGDKIAVLSETVTETAPAETATVEVSAPDSDTVREVAETVAVEEPISIPGWDSLVSDANQEVETKDLGLQKKEHKPEGKKPRSRRKKSQAEIELEAKLNGQ